MLVPVRVRPGVQNTRIGLKHFITFGNDSFAYQKQRLKKDATATGWFDTVTTFAPEDIAEFLQKYSKFIENNKRGYGYWIWKPYVILKTLQETAEGDLIFYVDSGSSIVPEKKGVFDRYVEQLEANPVVVFKLPDSVYTERMFCKIDTLKHYSTSERNLELDTEFLESGQVESGLFFCKNSAAAKKFVEDWLEGMLFENHQLVIDHSNYTRQLPGFIEHRHDQAVLSILSKLNGAAVLPTEGYGLGPFFSSRVSDEGKREFAPDIFRTEQDYNPTTHRMWSDYLKDATILAGVMQTYRDFLNSIHKQVTFKQVDFPVYQQVLNKLEVQTNHIVATKGIHSVEIVVDKPELFSKYCYESVTGSIKVVMLDPKKEYNLVGRKNTGKFYFHLHTSGVEISENTTYGNTYKALTKINYLELNTAYYLEQK